MEIGVELEATQSVSWLIAHLNKTSCLVLFLYCHSCPFLLHLRLDYISKYGLLRKDRASPVSTCWSDLQECYCFRRRHVHLPVALIGEFPLWLCFAGDRWETFLCESTCAFWCAVFLCWSPAYQTAHPAQWSGPTIIHVQLLHQVLLPQRGRHCQGDGLLHGPLQEGSAELFLWEGQREVLHTGHEEQNGALKV